VAQLVGASGCGPEETGSIPVHLIHVMGCSLMAKCLPVKEKDIGSSPIVPVFNIGVNMIYNKKEFAVGDVVWFNTGVQNEFLERFIKF